MLSRLKQTNKNNKSQISVQNAQTLLLDILYTNSDTVIIMIMRTFISHVEIVVWLSLEHLAMLSNKPLNTRFIIFLCLSASLSLSVSLSLCLSFSLSVLYYSIHFMWLLYVLCPYWLMWPRSTCISVHSNHASIDTVRKLQNVTVALSLTRSVWTDGRTECRDRTELTSTTYEAALRLHELWRRYLMLNHCDIVYQSLSTRDLPVGSARSLCSEYTLFPSVQSTLVNSVHCTLYTVPYCTVYTRVHCTLVYIVH